MAEHTGTPSVFVLFPALLWLAVLLDDSDPDQENEKQIRIPNSKVYETNMGPI